MWDNVFQTLGTESAYCILHATTPPHHVMNDGET